MKRVVILALAALVGSLIAYGLMEAATDQPATVEVEAHVLVKGKKIWFDKEQHTDVELRAGDRLRWVLRCDDCPDGSRLEIQNLRNSAILDLLDEPDRIKALDNAKANLPVAPDYKGKSTYNPGQAFLGGISRVDTMVFESPPYREFQHAHLWKFDWVIMMGDEQLARWDPHFSGCRRTGC